MWFSVTVMDWKLSKTMSMASAQPATFCSSRLANDFAFTPESSFFTSRSLSFAPSIRVEEPTHSTVAIRLRLLSFSGANDSITFQRPLNSSIFADELQDFRRDGDVPDLVAAVHLCPIFTRFQSNGNLYPFVPVYILSELGMMGRIQFAIHSLYLGQNVPFSRAIG